jgi:hypothetical protein
MNRHSGINDNNKKDRTKEATKTTATIPMVGAIVTAALLLSGLSLISSYQQPAIAQQNMTGGAGGNATTAAGGNATTAAGANQTTAEVMLHLEEVRTAIENDDDDAALMQLDLAIMALGGNATTGGATNATAAAEGTTAEGEGGEEEGEGGEEEGGTD